jgi:predicted nucleic acid-binding protein
LRGNTRKKLGEGELMEMVVGMEEGELVIDLDEQEGREIAKTIADK